MLSQILKLFSLQILIIFSLLVAGCGEGDRDFVPLASEPEEEELLSIFINSGAVKGPLVNAELNFYSVDLNAGLIKEHGDASEAFYSLLDEANVYVTGEEIVALQNGAAGTLNDALDYLKNRISQYGYVTQLAGLKRDIKKTTTVLEAQGFLDRYLNDTDPRFKETNEILSSRVKVVNDSYATLPDLKRKIAGLETFESELASIAGFGDAESIVSEYSSSEVDSAKLEGWASLEGTLSELRSNASTLTSIRLDLTNTTRDFLQTNVLENDPVARNRLLALIEDVKNAKSVSSAEDFVSQALAEEGNNAVRTVLRNLKRSIISIDDFIDKVQKDQALYHFSDLRNQIFFKADNSGTDDIQLVYNTISNTLKVELEPSLKEALKSSELNDDGQPGNLLFKGTSNETAYLANVNLEQYSGFVYMEAIANPDTVDLNSGGKSLVSKMDSIFHTDTIRGNGDNSQEDRRFFYSINGEEQRNTAGELITDRAEITLNAGDVLITHLPFRFSTPLTKFAVALAIKHLESYKPLLTDADGDGELEYRLSDAVFKSALSMASNDVIDAFGIDFSSDQSVFESTPVITLPMQFSVTDQKIAAQYRASIESFSAFLNSLNKQSGIDVDTLFDALVTDLLDQEMDGLNVKEPIAVFSGFPDISYLATLDPAEALIAGTDQNVSDIIDLMDRQLSTITPFFNTNLFSPNLIDVMFKAPDGGVDSDGDGVLNNSDEFPYDNSRIRDIPNDYPGIWAVNTDSSITNLMPLQGDFKFEVAVNTGLGLFTCDPEPCLIAGSGQTQIVDSWELISSPEGSGLVIDEPNDSSVVGFSASGSVPGQYLIKGTLTTSELPQQIYSFIVPIRIIDPQSIEVRFLPQAPKAGELVSVEFRVTDELCRLYSFCSGLNRDDDIEDYLDISELNDVFKIYWTINGVRSTNYRSLKSEENGLNVAAEINTVDGDALNINVIYSSGNVEFVSGNFSVIIGEQRDDDEDGVINVNDAFPDNKDCYRLVDGFTGADGSPICNSTFILNNSNAENEIIPIDFASESWQYNAAWGRVFRTDTAKGLFLESLDLPLSESNEIKEIGSEIINGETRYNVVVDEVTRRVYIAYSDGEIDYFSLNENKLYDFADSYKGLPVKSIQFIDVNVLVEHSDSVNPSEYRLYNRNGKEAVIQASSKYPKPGDAVSLEVDGKEVTAFAQSLQLEWRLTRLIDNNPEDIIIELSDDNLTLLSGQTRYGDIITVSFCLDGNCAEKEIRKTVVAVLDTSFFGLNSSVFDVTDTISLIANNFELDSELTAQFLKVKWLKSDPVYNPSIRHFQLFDLQYPFSFSAENTQYGDIVVAELYLEDGSNEGLFLESFFAVVVGNPSDSFASIVEFELESGTRNFSAQITSPNVSNEFFTEFFTPIWIVNSSAVPGENGLSFPSNSDTNIKFGDSLSVAFRYEFDTVRNETPAMFLTTVDVAFAVSEYSLSPRFPDVGQNISLDFDDYTEEVLSPYVPRWYINGVLDTSATEYEYSGENLKYGDHVLLEIERVDNDPDDDVEPEKFADSAEVYVGVNIVEADIEAGLDTDLDGILNKNDYFRFDPACSAESEGNPDDSDGDGLNDLAELNGPWKSNPNLIDTDGDGLSDYEEMLASTNPLDIDTDNDGFNDGYEVNELDTDPNNALDPASSAEDLDRDGMTNEEELEAGTKANQVDSDNDGLFDGMEITQGTNPLNPDTDGDGLSDGLEFKITKTQPLNPDSDMDGLSDGEEVRLLGFNPNDMDTNDNKILDSLEPEVAEMGVLPQGYINVGDLNNYKFGKIPPLVPSGTCFVSWLGQQNIEHILVSHEPQLDISSDQQLLFSSYEWSEIIRYDAKNKKFINSLGSESIKGNITALEYNLSSLDKVYLGYLNGYVREYDSATEIYQDVFYVGESARILQIVDQGDFLLVETEDLVQGGYTHYLFNKGLAQLLPVDSINSDVSYRNRVWRDANSPLPSRTELWMLGNETSDATLIFETIDLAGAGSLSQSLQQNLGGLTLKAPMFIETLQNVDALRFGSGHSYDFTSNVFSSDALVPFEQGFQQNLLRVTVPENTSQVQLNLQEAIVSDTYWRTEQQLERDKVLRVLPSGESILGISHRTLGINQLSNQPPLSFEMVSFGDFDNDGLSDEEEVSNGSDPGLIDTDGDGLSDYIEVSVLFTDPINPDSDADGIFDGDEDNDNDGLSNIIETTLTFTNPGLPDSDGDGFPDGNKDYDQDGLSNIIELQQSLTNPALKDSDANGIADGDEDFDQDGLTNLQELLITFTDMALNDTDGDGILDGDEDSDADGLSDSIELNNTQTRIDDQDSDNNGTLDGDEDKDQDGLTNLQEVSVTMTDPANADSDGDHTNDANEDSDNDGIVDLLEFKAGTDVLSKDFDGDGLSDRQEIYITFTDPRDNDSDNDGILDGDEDSDNDGINDRLELNSTKTNHLLSDSDGDGVSDADEDSDNDGLPNYLEITQLSTNPGLVHTDGNSIRDGDKDTDTDGLTNIQEFTLTQTDILNPDTDNDGIIDGDEDTDGDGLNDGIELNLTQTDFDNIDTDSDGINDPDEDKDLDGLSNIIEVSQTLTNPALFDSNSNKISDGQEDQDNDGLTNAQEFVNTLTNLILPDTDADGVLDGDEDSDGDGLSDAVELNQTETDIGAIDSDFNGINDANEDFDEDGLSNLIEFTQTLTHPALKDSDENGINDGDEDFDKDGLSNAIEFNFTQTDFSLADSDANGINDGSEDRDQDGLTNLQELNITYTDPALFDTDGDGISDGDEDRDNDGLSDSVELNITKTRINNTDSNGDGIPDGQEDKDKDGLININEIIASTSLVNADTDQDGIGDNDEVSIYSTDPTVSDSDGDGLSDSDEINITNTDPNNNDTDNNGIIDGDEDSDGDGFSDSLEIVTYKSDPFSDDINLDSDGDGLINADELVLYNTNPKLVDTDSDGLSDGAEINTLGTEPLLFDTDTDGLSDGDEIKRFLTNALDIDTDNDGLSDFDEVKVWKTDPLSIDSDSDTITDFDEVSIHFTNPNLVDTDGDGLTDQLELFTSPSNPLLFDTDNDGLSDGQERNITLTDPLLDDTDGNEVKDGDEDFDSDGLTNIQELGITLTDINLADTNGDGTLDGDEDTDGDGLSDRVEIRVVRTAFNNQDSDGDGINDGDEDKDRDGLSNQVEANVTGTSPILVDTDGNGIIDAKEDPDNDGLTNLQEVNVTLTNPLIADTDANGISDGDEDTDSDGLSNSVELNLTQTEIGVVDSDGDGIVDGDEDFDQDGLSNLDEITKTFTNPARIDSDGNNISDGTEDFDMDGLTNLQELMNTNTDPANADTNSDGIIDGDIDTDNDGLSDSVELNLTQTEIDNVDSDANGVNDGDEDLDQDGLANLIELLQTLTDPSLIDTDTNGVNDGDEDKDQDGLSVLQELFTTLTDPDQADSNSNGVADGDEDRDLDGLSDSVELNLTQTDFDSVDSDANGVNDGDEDPDQDGLSSIIEVSQSLTNPILADTDGNEVNDGDEDLDQDGLTNLQEVLVTFTDPGDADSDNDGVIDGDEDRDNDGLSDRIELTITLTAFDIADTDGNGINDDEEDLDQDGLSNSIEVLQTQTNPLAKNTDGKQARDGDEDKDQDGLTNLQELNVTFTDLINPDTDNDGIPDGAEDRDNDGLSDSVELNITMTSFNDADSDGDGINDGDEDTDLDGLSNLVEISQTQTNPALVDSDFNGINDGDEDTDLDGLSDFIELYVIATDFDNDDTDGDGINDGDEDFDQDGISNVVEATQTLSSLLLIDTDGNGINDGDEDKDQDGLSNLVELAQTMTRPDMVDSDFNGINDGDEDFDGDGLSNIQEVLLTLTIPNNVDSNNNGINDGDEDTDLDGLSDALELNFTRTDFNNIDTDGNGINDGDEFFDTDGDGLSNDFELILGTCVEYEVINCPVPQDTDQDGVGDFDEVLVFGTNPSQADTDGDGILDYVEVFGGLSDPTTVDSDLDGLSDTEELGLAIESPLYRSDPKIQDTDGDGLTDFFEADYKFAYSEEQLDKYGLTNPPGIINPMNEDTDGDGLSDGFEVNVSNSNPALADTDNDGLNDFDEINFANGSITDLLNRDSDSDGLLDGQEVMVTLTDPNDTDSDDDGVIDGDEDRDSDGLTDSQELNLTLTRFDVADTDEDGILDNVDDEDGDTLTNEFEIEIGTDPLLVDTDGDGIPDNEENLLESSPTDPDSDRDGLLDGEELELGTDLNDPDTDKDGVIDGQEVLQNTDPLNPDTDHDFVSDFDDIFPLNFDSDSDGIPDGIEILVEINSDPRDLDSDEDGLNDGQEAWVYAFDHTGELLSTGVSRDIKLNSREGDTRFNPIAFEENEVDKDRLVIDLWSVAGRNASELVGTLYVKRVSNPAVKDSDGDGLNDFTELMQIEKVFGNGFDPDLLTVTTYDPNLSNKENFSVSDPWVVDTDGDGINDGDEDIDSDFLVNTLDQDNDATNVILPDSDPVGNSFGDGLLDGIEVLLLSSAPDKVDSDEDGISDRDELSDPVTWRAENSGASLACRDDEIRLPDIAGVTYCFTINYLSLPNRADSDSDGVLDPDDSYALDATCSASTDGFIDLTTGKNERKCFSSWMAEQGDLEQIRFAQWKNLNADDQSQIAFYSEGWDKVVRYDALSAHYLDLIDTTDNLVQIEYSPLNHRLYLAYSDGVINYFDLVTGIEVSYAELVLSGNSLDALAVAGTSLIVQLVDQTAQQYEHIILDATAQIGPPLAGAEYFNIDGAFWDEASSRLYAYQQIPDEPAQAITDIGYIEVDVVASQFSGALVYSNSFAADEVINGPIAVSQDRAFIYLGSGQKRLPELTGSENVPRLEKSYQGVTYNRFYDLMEVNEHFVSVVDFATENNPDNSLNIGAQNSIFIEDISSPDFVNNLYLSPPLNETEKILKLVPFLNLNNPELAIVSRDVDAVMIENLGLLDEDNDGMTGIYERTYGLDDADSSDRFMDPDDDLLTNIEEYKYATDPLNEDTDGDTWSDAYEVSRETDPLDPEDF